MHEKTCHIHIGINKTGSTSIQNTLFANRKVLLNSDINYLALGENHSIVFRTLFNDAPENFYANRRKNLLTREMALDHNRILKSKLIKELENNSSSDMVISGEGLSNIKHSHVKEIKAFLSHYFDKFVIYAYVRHPYSFLSSAAQQRLKLGKTLEYLQANPPVPEYRLRLLKYIEEYGKENVRLREFTPSAFLDNDVVLDFLNWCFPNRNFLSHIKLIRANESLSHEAATILSIINNQDLRYDASNHDLRVSLIKWLVRIKNGTGKFKFTGFDVDAWIKSIKDDVLWLAEITNGAIAFDLEEIAKIARENNPMKPIDDGILSSVASLIGELVFNLESKNQPKERSKKVRA